MIYGILRCKRVDLAYMAAREFSINQKWMLSKFGIYVYKIEIPKFFNLAWLPESLILTRKTKKISKRYSGIKTFKSLKASIKH